MLKSNFSCTVLESILKNPEMSLGVKNSHSSWKLTIENIDVRDPSAGAGS